MKAPPLLGRVLGSDLNDFVIAEWTEDVAPQGTRRLIAPLHTHRRDDEAWYALEGSLCVQIGSQEVLVEAGCSILVPKGVEHTFWNPGQVPVRYLLIMTQRIFRLVEAIHATEERSPAALAELFERFDSALSL